ncbi:MAG: rod shape-determining protein MreC [Oscillospiraceae bacterium]|jgi:rod shape-determining protein MreC|nr:rod shape-determining protein MreC [Oscillospiraceae bacterium]
MRVFVTKRNVIILIVAVLIATVAIVAVNTTGTPGAVSTAADVIVKPLKNAVAAMARTFESIYGYMYEYDKVVAENNMLKEQIAGFKQDYREYTEVSEENARLRDLLGLTARHSDRKYDTATILSWSASNWQSSFTLSKGSTNSEVSVGDAVITETGVIVGRISKVDLTTSTAVSVIDTTFSAGALIGELGANGVITGDFALMREGLLKLDYLSDDTAVLAGDSVVTSGKSGVLPEGLVIGEVARVLRNPTGLGMYAEVRPAAEVRNAGVSYVYIITEFTVTG